MTSRLSSILPIWLLAVVGVVLIGVLSTPAHYFTWLSVALGAVVIATFLVQLAVPTKQGLVPRMMASIGGAAVVIAIATAVLGPLSA